MVGSEWVSGGGLDTDLGKKANMKTARKQMVFLRLVSKGIELDRLPQLFEV